MSKTNGADCGFLRDGYTKEGYIKAELRLYPALRFTYRPALQVDRIVIADERRKAQDRGDIPRCESLAASAMKSRLMSWDLKDDRGQPVEITEDNILRMVPHLNTLLFNVIMGYSPCDEDPEAAEEERAAENERQLARAIAGESEEEASAKNSAAG